MRPKSVEVHPVYKCNECGSRHCESLDYVNRIGKIICGCGNLITLDPIQTFKISPVYKNLATTKDEKKQSIHNIQINTSKNSKPLKKEYSEKCVSLLVSLGWKKRESKKIVSQVFNLWKREMKLGVNSRNFEEFISYLMRNQKC